MHVVIIESKHERFRIYLKHFMALNINKAVFHDNICMYGACNMYAKCEQFHHNFSADTLANWINWAILCAIVVAMALYTFALHLSWMGNHAIEKI